MDETTEVERLRLYLTQIWHAANNPNYEDADARLRMVHHTLSEVGRSDPAALTV